MELSKKEKKIAREVIEKGLQVEFVEALHAADSVLKEWKNQTMDSRTAYHALYKSMVTFDKHIAGRYDNMTGSKYVFIIAAQLADEVISKDALKDFSEQVQKAIIHMSGREE